MFMVISSVSFTDGRLGPSYTCVLFKGSEFLHRPLLAPLGGLHAVRVVVLSVSMISGLLAGAVSLMTYGKVATSNFLSMFF
jgi:hypothetical protein